MATSDQSPRPRGILGYVLPSRFNARTAIWLVNSRRTLHLSQYSDRSILPQQNLLSLLLFGFLWSNEGLEKWLSNYWIRLSYDMKNYVDREDIIGSSRRIPCPQGLLVLLSLFLSIFCNTQNTDDILLDIENVFQIWSTSTSFEEVARVWANQKRKNVLNE